MFLGSAILVPISEVGSVASAIGWFAVCAAFLYMNPSSADFLIALLGTLVGLAMALMKFLPFVPGHFSVWEWCVLGLWIMLGTLFRQRRVVRLPTQLSGADENATNPGINT
jgi:hypothetical protein